MTPVTVFWFFDVGQNVGGEVEGRELMLPHLLWKSLALTRRLPEQGYPGAVLIRTPMALVPRQLLVSGSSLTFSSLLPSRLMRRGLGNTQEMEIHFLYRNKL